MWEDKLYYWAYRGSPEDYTRPPSIKEFIYGDPSPDKQRQVITVIDKWKDGSKTIRHYPFNMVK